MSRSAGPIASAAIVGVVLWWGNAAGSASPMTDVELVAASQSPCAATSLCAADPAPDAGDQATAEQRIIEGYVKKQIGCTPDLPANPQSVTWDPPGFTPNVGGSGNIIDADPRLGGHFTADYVNGHWHLAYLYC
ncbi:integrase [Mycobacterium szulgai]|uniref:Integrase n=1 Tax=Mycobacterium szulgai TaxID=1787 RepID=A0A1X2ECW3_MYCSZ|nr:integrase [Mycobacterium szulgai]MCV7076887.1 integrase [Mycobacterium szulgai]ORW98190.1 integrase [Mycobacterium szulgai]